uniref:Chaperonin GroEL n=1 Tax=Hildenbrandia rivularis TaxID=135206 RepID=A0A1C9CFM6_9FLOR|nr:chaperonin GroEL [Hildenbrandia rivularis]AOM67200.1 chaperonin GroEL [Hildenbrandia rivularis]
MMTQILYQEKARKTLIESVKTITKIVSIALGPSKHNILLHKQLSIPTTPNNGFTIIKEIELQDHLRNIGIKLISQAAVKTYKVARDGTITTIIIASVIIHYSIKHIIAGSNIIDLIQGITKAIEFSSQKIVECSQPVNNNKTITQIATIASNYDQKIGSTIAKIIEQIGYEGTIDLEDSKTTDTSIEVFKDIKIDKGFISPLFVKNNQTMEIIQNSPYILITDEKITSVQEELIPILELVSKTKKPLLIIAEDLSAEVLSTLIVNHLENIINVVAIRPPGFGNRRKLYLEDISAATNSSIIGEVTGLRLSSIQLYMLGKASKTIITRNSTTIILNKQQHIHERCNQLRKQIDISNTTYEKENLKNRLAKISGKSAVIKVGAATSTELDNKKTQFKNAIQSVKNAAEEGIIPGGGSMNIHLAKNILLWANNNLDGDQLIGALIIKDALLKPTQQILQSTGSKQASIFAKLQTYNFTIGYDILSHRFVNMYEEGIIDSAKVMRLTLQNAASIAKILLTTECIIINNTHYDKH